MRKYHFDENLYLEVTEERLNVIYLAFQKCGSYCSFGKAIGMTRHPAQDLLFGKTKHITKDRWEKVRLIAAKGRIL